jgi:hypothetical protein
MTFSELGPIIGVLGFLLAVSGFIRTEQVRRLAAASDVGKKLEETEKRLSILEIQLAPLFTVMNNRVASMFHQDSPSTPDAMRLDRLIERFQSDSHPLRPRLSDRDIDEMITLIYRLAQQSARGGPAENAEEHFRANFFLAQLDGLRDVRAYVREQAREAAQRPTPQESHGVWITINDWWQTLVSWLKSWRS